MSLLTLENVSKRFGDRLILDGVSFSLDTGEFLSVLGKSGSGKTTLLRLIAGFERADGGEIILDRKIISSSKVHMPTEKRDVGIVFQDHALWPHMTIAENVGFPLKIRKLNAKAINSAVMEALDLMEMGRFENAYPHQLSGGEAQRVALARTLVQKPKIIIFDEPLASLDALLRHDLQRLIKSTHHKHKLTCIYITHDQTEAMRLSDRVAVLEDGRILQLDTPEMIYTSPATPSIAKLINHGMCVAVSVSESYGDSARVEFMGSTFKVRAVEKTHKKQGIVCLRSEDILLGTEKTPLQAHVIDCCYVGGAYQIELTLDGAPNLLLWKRVNAPADVGTAFFVTFQGGWLIPKS